MPGEPLRVGVIGLGDIAQTAYLPVLAARADVTLALLGRDNDRLTRIGRQYGAPRCVTRLDDLLESGIDVAFVHTSTEAHFGLVERLLSAGIHVLVDKPLAPSLADARHLVDLADRYGLRLRSASTAASRRRMRRWLSLATEVFVGKGPRRNKIHSLRRVARQEGVVPVSMEVVSY